MVQSGTDAGRCPERASGNGHILNQKLVGRSIARLEDVPLLTGSGRFVDDFAFPGMLHACFLRSAHAHASLCRTDTSVAATMDGVRAVYAFADIRPHLSADRLVVALPSKAFRQQLDRPVLAIDEVVYVGEPIAVVIAETRHQAEDAVAAIEVEYEPLRPSSIAGPRWHPRAEGTS
jgi:carbon-monoxide dehydrogenase large subunit